MRQQAQAAATAGRTLLAWVWFRLGRRAEQRRDWRAAGRAYWRAARLRPDSGAYHFRAGRTCERLKDWQGAAAAYTAAIERRGDCAAWHARRAAAHERLGQRAEAEAGYRAALALDPGPAEWHYRLARLARAREDYRVAARALRAAISRDPAKALYHFELGLCLERSAERVGFAQAWKRRAAQAPPGEPPAWVEALEETAASEGQAAALEQALQAYRRASKRAPDRADIVFRLAQVLEKRGEWAAAAAAHARALSLALAMGEEESPSRIYRHDYCRARAGLGEAPKRLAWPEPAAAPGEAPAWSAVREMNYALRPEEAARRLPAELATTPAGKALRQALADNAARLATEGAGEGGAVPAPDPAAVSLRPPVAGHWEVVASLQRIEVRGCLHEDTPRVQLFLDDRLVRAVNVERRLQGGVPQRHFTFSFGSGVLRHLPERIRLAVGCQRGLLLHLSGETEITLCSRGGSGRLMQRLRRGSFISKKGTLVDPGRGLANAEAELLQAYARLRRHFEQHLGRPLFLLFGTLLGQVRAGALLPGDDDFDVGYVSRAETPEAVKQEAVEIVVALAEAGFELRTNNSGRLFKVRVEGHWIDVFPVWADHGRIWIHNATSYEGSLADFLPPQTAAFGETEVLLPRDPEAFLAGNYGPGWRRPDPGFRYARQTRVRRYLSRAHLTAEEFAGLQAQLDRLRAANPTVGTFQGSRKWLHAAKYRESLER